MGSVIQLDAPDVLTRRLALRFQLSQSMFLARAEGAAAALERMGLPDIAQGLRAASGQAQGDSEALLSRVNPEQVA